MAFNADTFIATSNNTGFVTTHIDPYMQAFIDHPVAAQPCLEIGAGHGHVTLAALKKGHTIICNDLSSEHLDIIKNKIPTELTKFISYAPGRFPQDLHIAEKSISAIFASRIFHFFKPEELELAMTEVARILTPGGSIYLTVETPYLESTKKFLPEFERRLAANESYPGFIANRRLYSQETETQEDLKHIPEFIHFFSKETLMALFLRFNFEIEACSYVARKNIFPDRFTNDLGKESVGIIARCKK
jgi:ubiquinone/menaquinone biosynthesis C-methylase UbiE